ncbi:sushi, von Willebrand factor type A, EGF and pentraxin domain-containing protein 1-like [Ptychodera flava]|uniref:sushi, von Willebrand factor type A, EGF and pentraxin domain-containing protein 1-like n=1 Tax=Ptychodera flava TaxID=63121 RepID=UPI00396A10ED
MSVKTEEKLLLVLIFTVVFVNDLTPGKASAEYVRLVGGYDKYDGHLELYIAELGWTPVCKWRFDLIDEDIVCRELARPGAMHLKWTDDDYLLSDTRPRIINVICDGDEESIANCTYSNVQSCSNSARVKCNYVGYIGCYESEVNGPVLSGDTIDDNAMTINMCLDQCRGTDQDFAGLTRGTQCVCGSDDWYTSRSESTDKCKVKCRGDDSQLCGGSKHTALYSTSIGACGGDVTEPTTFYSPGYPGNIPANTDCTWNIVFPEGDGIQLEFIPSRGADITGSVRVFQHFPGRRVEMAMDSAILQSKSNVVDVQVISDASTTDAVMFTVEVTAFPAVCPVPSTLDARSTIYPDALFEEPTVVGDSVSVSCQVGYTLLSAYDTVVCQADSTWNDTFPQCTIKDCGDPGTVDNAERIGTSFAYEGEVTYECHQGFSGGGAISCTADETWTDKPVCDIMDCGDPGDVDNAEREGDQFTYSHTVTFNCNEGHYSDGNNVITCQANGTWTEKPQCPPIDCGDPGLLANADRVGEGFTYDQTVTYTCHTGYHSIGDTTVTCQQSALWTDKPECVKIDCGEPVEVENADREGDDFTYNSTVKFNCHIGYQSDGKNAITCTENGVWTASPQCIKIDCGDPGVVENAERTGSDFTYNQAVTFQCHEGYHMNGSDIIMCGLNGAWTDKPQCLQVDCGDPGNIANADRDGEDFTYDQTVTYTCHTGYHSVGNSIVTCQENALWTDKPECAEIDCGEPSDIENADREGDDFTYDSTVNYNCHPGYQISGNNAITCKENGDWTEAPQCTIIDCGDPGVVENADRTGSDFTYNQVVTIQCHEGYYMNGSDVMTCGLNGAWTDKPQCLQIDCGDPGNIANADRDGEDFTYDQTVTYTCHTGYHSIGNNIVRCQQNTLWTDKPECLEIDCGAPSDIENADREGDDFTYNSTVNYNCHPGYQISGNNAITCKENGDWTEAPQCTIIDCGDPGDVENAERTGNEFTYNQAVTFQCHEGYNMNGSNMITCGLDGAWTEKPQCLQVDCGDPGNIANADRDGEDFTYDQTVTYTCHTGYHSIGNNIVRCQQNALWTNQPECVKIDCGEPTDVENADREGDDFTYNSTVNYNCHPGYQISGNNAITCKENGDWTEAPQCVIIDCGDPGDVENAGKTGNDFTYNQAVTFQCHEGYHMNGSNMITCGLDGAWTEKPQCLEVDCGDPGNIANADRDGEDFTYNQTVTYTCHTGYHSIGNNNQVRCQQNALWTDKPECVKIDCGEPTDVQYADREGDYFTYNSTVNYNCHPGYQSSGNNVITCKENGDWTEAPRCTVIDCGDPGDVENAERTGNEFMYNQAVTFQCHEGYHMNGSNIITCGLDGAWTEKPQCLQVDCGDPGNIVNANRDGEEFTYNQTVTYNCHTGYHSIGNNIVRCQQNELWTNQPECVKIDCGEPTDVKNADREGDDFTYNSTVNYNCHPGYQISGNNAITCKENGDWTEAPQCIIIDCGDPGTVEKAERVGNVFTYNQTVTFQCYDGYYINGSKEMTCGLNGAWTEKPQCLQVDCDDPGPVANADMEGEEFTYDSIVIYNCHVGYHSSSNRAVMCQEDATWTDKPSCDKIDCGEPDEVDNADKDGDEYTYNATVTYKCHVGYYNNGDNTVNCQATGVWTDTPDCHKIACDVPGDVKYATKEGDDYTYDGQITYTCSDGYYSNDNMVIVCQEDGTWTEKPQCLEIGDCEDPGDVANATKEGKDFTYNSTVVYKCQHGYRSKGSATIVCKEDGDWTEKPECLQINCGDPGIIDNARRKGDDFSYNSTLTYICNEGYRSTGNMEMACQENGTWTEKPKCEIIDCGDPGEVENADRKGDNVTYNSTVIYICHDGYYSNSSNVIYCQGNATWTGKPDCISNSTSGETAAARSKLSTTTIIIICVAVWLLLFILIVVILVICKRMSGKKSWSPKGGDVNEGNEMQEKETATQTEHPAEETASA